MSINKAVSEPRVVPLLPPELNTEQAAWMAPFTDCKGRYPNVFGVLSRHMQLLNSWTPFGLYTMRGSRVPPPLREVLILRTARICASEYERHQHRRIALALGMTAETLDAVDTGVSTGDADHDLMIAVANELARDSRLSDATWAEMILRFDVETALDAIFTVGAYTTMAFALNSCDVQIESQSA